ncbi:MAG: hypothetical protein WD058_02685 [Dehalococcoidia bacterium]
MNAQHSTPHATTAPPRRARPSTGWVALLGATAFVSGFFLLAAAGHAFEVRLYALILGGASLVTLPVLALALLVAASESLVTRAWAGGFRALLPGERRAQPTVARGLRYAGYLWLANGGALWVAALTTRF